jgi:hypothetical protein
MMKTAPRTIRLFAVALVAATTFALSACSPGNVIAPVTESANDLQGTTVDLKVGQVLNINTGDLAVDSYEAEVTDASVVEFVQGREDGDATYNPGFTAKAEGTTEVTMTNEQGGIQPLEFTIVVTK